MGTTERGNSKQQHLLRCHVLLLANPSPTTYCDERLLSTSFLQHLWWEKDLGHLQPWPWRRTQRHDLHGLEEWIDVLAQTTAKWQNCQLAGRWRAWYQCPPSSSEIIARIGGVLPRTPDTVGSEDSHLPDTNDHVVLENKLKDKTSSLPNSISFTGPSLVSPTNTNNTFIFPTGVRSINGKWLIVKCYKVKLAEWMMWSSVFTTVGNTQYDTASPVFMSQNDIQWYTTLLIRVTDTSISGSTVYPSI